MRNVTSKLTTGVFRGWGDGATPCGLTENFFGQFLYCFISFVSRLNRKIRVPRLLVTVRVFCLLKSASKCTQINHFGDKNNIFW